MGISPIIVWIRTIIPCKKGPRAANAATFQDPANFLKGIPWFGNMLKTIVAVYNIKLLIPNLRQSVVSPLMKLWDSLGSSRSKQ